MTLPNINTNFDLNPELLETIATVTEETRIKIILFLGAQGPVCVNDIASQFSISRPAISHHLKVLKNHKLVKSEKKGQEIYYQSTLGRLSPKLRELADLFEECCPAD